MLVARTCRFSRPSNTAPNPAPAHASAGPKTVPHMSTRCPTRNQWSSPVSLPTAQSPAFAESPSCGGGWLVTRHVGRLTTTWPRGEGARRAILRNTSTTTRRSSCLSSRLLDPSVCLATRKFRTGTRPALLAALEHQRNFVCVMSFGSRITIATTAGPVGSPTQATIANHYHKYSDKRALFGSIPFGVDFGCHSPTLTRPHCDWIYPALRDQKQRAFPRRPGGASITAWLSSSLWLATDPSRQSFAVSSLACPADTTTNIDDC